MKFQIGNREYDSLVTEIPVNPNISGGVYKRRDFGHIKKVIWHHSAYDNLSLMELAERCANDGRYPRIPYHIGVDPGANTAVYNPLDALCWAADGSPSIEGVGINNWEGINIVLLGNFDEHEPTVVQLKKALELHNECSYAMGKVLGAERHSDVQNTNCPGKTSRGVGNWFDRLFAPASEIELLKARIIFLEKQANILALRLNAKDIAIAGAIPNIESGLARLKRGQFD